MVDRGRVPASSDDDGGDVVEAVTDRRDPGRSDPGRSDALPLLDAEQIVEADRRLQEAYRQQPQDPDLVAASHRLAAETAPPW